MTYKRHRTDSWTADWSGILTVRPHCASYDRRPHKLTQRAWEAYDDDCSLSETPAEQTAPYACPEDTHDWQMAARGSSARRRTCLRRSVARHLRRTVTDRTSAAAVTSSFLQSHARALTLIPSISPIVGYDKTSYNRGFLAKFKLAL